MKKIRRKKEEYEENYIFKPPWRLQNKIAGDNDIEPWYCSYTETFTSSVVCSEDESCSATIYVVVEDVFGKVSGRYDAGVYINIETAPPPIPQ
ncbi:MAG: hypothetical protein KJ737_21050 [Proteobacteria bacterium]|nr:hypothetical protein [Pseudomonadota bacterium]